MGVGEIGVISSIGGGKCGIVEEEEKEEYLGGGFNLGTRML